VGLRTDAGTRARWVRVIVLRANEWPPAVRAGREEEVARAVAAGCGPASGAIRAADALTCTSRPTYDRSAVSVASRFVGAQIAVRAAHPRQRLLADAERLAEPAEADRRVDDVPQQDPCASDRTYHL
jgi:hypothetical protein